MVAPGRIQAKVVFNVSSNSALKVEKCFLLTDSLAILLLVFQKLKKVNYSSGKSKLQNHFETSIIIIIS